MNIRTVQPSDANELSRLLLELGHTIEPELLATKVSFLLTLSDLYGTFVAISDGSLVGLVSSFVTHPLHWPHPVGRISVLVVAATHAGTGVGTALVRRAEAFFQSTGCKRVEVTSSQERSEAHAFYRRRSYRQQGVRFIKLLD